MIFVSRMEKRKYISLHPRSNFILYWDTMLLYLDYIVNKCLLLQVWSLHILLDVFELDRPPGKMQVESSENMLFLFREYNESVRTWLRVVQDDDSPW